MPTAYLGYNRVEFNNLRLKIMENEQPEIVHIDPIVRKNPFKGLIKEILVFVFIVFGIILPFRIYIAEPYLVSGASMEPNFETSDYLIVDKIIYRHKIPERNSVIIFKFPLQTQGVAGKNLIKRVIGLPGDTVTMSGQTITIKNKNNPEGFVLDQSYLTLKSSSDFSLTLKDDQYFVMGDNRPESYDSRSWGILPAEDIIGRPILRLFPFNKIASMPSDYSKVK